MLWVFAVAWLTQLTLDSLLHKGDAPLRIYVAATAVLVVAVIFLLRGSRIAWIFFILGNGGAVISALGRDDSWWAIVHGALLVPLFAPDTLRYIWRQRSRANGQPAD